MDSCLEGCIVSAVGGVVVAAGGELAFSAGQRFECFGQISCFLLVHGAMINAGLLTQKKGLDAISVEPLYASFEAYDAAPTACGSAGAASWACALVLLKANSPFS